MKKVLKIDSNGFFIEDIFLDDNEELTSDLIGVSCPNGFEKPKWDGTKWVEGLTQSEIDAIKNVVILPTLEERLASAEEMLSMLMGV